jgi:hypothetical protein
MAMIDRISEKFVVVKSGCWEWQAALDANGYGKIWDGKAVRLAHRVVYEMEVGPIPEGLDIDHLCRVTRCVNPEHLEPVTRSENLRRGEVGGYWGRQTECRRGHEYTEENTRIINRKDGTQERVCKECARERVRKHRAGR